MTWLPELTDLWKSALAKVAQGGDRSPRSMRWAIPLLILGTVGCTAGNTPDSVDTPSASTAAENEEAAETSAAASSVDGKVAPSPDELCAEVEPGEPQQAIALTNLQFHRPAPIPFEFDAKDDEPVDHLIGCITNQTDQEISGVHLQMDFQTQDGSGFASAQIEFPGTTIAPGQTVPFKHRTELDTNTTEMTITEVTTLEPMPGQEEYAFQTIDTFQPQIKVTYVPAQAPASESVDEFCADVDASASDAAAPLAVNKLQIYDLPQDIYDFREEPISTVVGCVTNLSEEPMYGLGMAYNTGGATIELPVEAVQPGQTVAFRKFGDLSEGENSIHIHYIGDLAVNRLLTR